MEVLNGFCKISLESEYDPKGYCTKSEERELIFNLYKDMLHFENYIGEYKNKRHLEYMLFSALNSEDANTQLSEE